MHMRHQNMSATRKLLDEGIVDTFVCRTGDSGEPAAQLAVGNDSSVGHAAIGSMLSGTASDRC
jgi:hypothetical protein